MVSTLDRFAALLACAALASGCFIGGKGDGDLSPQAFSEQFADKLCSEYASCNPEIECSTDEAETLPEECSFSSDAADACLDGDFLCNDEFGNGFEFVEVPSACESVFDCGSVTQVSETTATGTVAD